MSDQQLVSLDEIKAHIENAAKDTVLAKIELGRWLQLARDHFKADQEFGHWRKQNIPWMSRRSATEHISVFEKFGGRLGADRELPSYSVLRELAKGTTPEATVEAVLANPEGWTKRDVKERIAADREDLEGPKDPPTIVTFYERVWNTLSSNPMTDEANRACSDWLAKYGDASAVVAKDFIRSAKEDDKGAHPFAPSSGYSVLKEL